MCVNSAGYYCCVGGEVTCLSQKSAINPIIWEICHLHALWLLEWGTMTKTGFRRTATELVQQTLEAA